MFVDAVFFPRTVLQYSNVRHNKKGGREEEKPHFPLYFRLTQPTPGHLAPTFRTYVCVRNLYITLSDTAATASIA